MYSLEQILFPVFRKHQVSRKLSHRMFIGLCNRDGRSTTRGISKNVSRGRKRQPLRIYMRRLLSVADQISHAGKTQDLLVSKILIKNKINYSCILYVFFVFR